MFEAGAWVTLGAFVVGVFGAWALFWLREVAAVPWPKNAAVPSENADERYQWVVACRRAARPLLAGLSLMIVAAVFATGALVNLVEAAFGDSITVVAGVAVMFGALLSIALALAYFPTHRAIEDQADEIVDDVAPVTLGNTDPSTLETRVWVSEYINAGTSGRATIEENLLIAGPLLSSLVTVILA